LIPIRYQVQLAGEPDIDDYFAVLNSHDGVITGRFHTVCFCLGLRIPVVALTSNSPKIESILFDAGLDVKRRMISLTTLTNVPQFTEDETGALDRFLENSELEYVNLFQKLRNLVATN
jgi:polysaccharide pyruvyl transferase WcaK-like protein